MLNRSKNRWLGMVLPVVLLFGLAAGSAGAGVEADQERLKKQIAQSATLRIAYWGRAWARRPLTGRIEAAPAPLVEKIRLENQLAGFQERPGSVTPPPEIALAVNAISVRLPPQIRRILDRRLIGIFTVARLGGTGYSEVVYDRKKKARYGIIVVDAGILKQKRANAWAAWKINSMFKPVPGSTVRVRAVLEAETDDTPVNAVRFILLHEFGHLLGMATRVHPPWPTGPSGEQGRLDTGFPALSWQRRADNRPASRFDARFPERKKIRAYAFDDAQLPISRVSAVYANLELHSNFPTLYACESPWEDFAESFATYFHVVIDRRPWQVIVEEAGRPNRVIESCWGTPRCREKAVFLERWFENPGEE